MKPCAIINIVIKNVSIVTLILITTLSLIKYVYS